jgi:hypothetical protein
VNRLNLAGERVRFGGKLAHLLIVAHCNLALNDAAAPGACPAGKYYSVGGYINVRGASVGRYLPVRHLMPAHYFVKAANM